MKIRTLFFAVLATMALSACGGKDNPIVPSISISGVSNPLMVAAAGASENVSLTASLSWTVSTNASNWISLSASNGTGGSNIPVQITVAENYGEERTGEVTFSISGTSTTSVLKVVQAAAEGIHDDDPPVVTGEQVFLQTFADPNAGLADFTVKDVNKGGFPGNIWDTDPKHPEYGAKAQAYVSSTASRYKTESWLLSPLINLKGHTTLYLRFQHALNYTNGEDVGGFIGLKISADKGANWKDVAIPKNPVGSNFEFLSSGDIDLTDFKDKIIQLAFVYKSTTSTTPTWEVKDVLISENKEVIAKVDHGDEYNDVPVWMELPEVKDKSKFHIHTAPINQVNYRNYSFVYDESHMVATWVAYPLCDLYTKKTVKRTDAWAFDPFVSVQPNFYKAGDIYDSKNGTRPSYNRGHQLPSADRLAGTDLNKQTFYYTNIAPQLADKAFNAGVWGQLEDAVRTWSQKSEGTDTLYVVTGCAVDKPIETRLDNDGKTVYVPNAFFKALVRLSGGEYIGAAFWLEHVDSSASYDPNDPKLKAYAMPIKDLETKLGMTFFVNLPSDKATTVKAQNPTDEAFWNLK